MKYHQSRCATANTTIRFYYCSYSNVIHLRQHAATELKRFLQNDRKPRVSFGEARCFDDNGSKDKKNGNDPCNEKSNKIPSCSPTCADLYPEDFKNAKLMRALSGNVLKNLRASFFFALRGKLFSRCEKCYSRNQKTRRR